MIWLIWKFILPMIKYIYIYFFVYICWIFSIAGITTLRLFDVFVPVIIEIWIWKLQHGVFEIDCTCTVTYTFEDIIAHACELIE